MPEAQLLGDCIEEFGMSRTVFEAFLALAEIYHDHHPDKLAGIVPAVLNKYSRQLVDALIRKPNVWLSLGIRCGAFGTMTLLHRLFLPISSNEKFNNVPFIALISLCVPQDTFLKFLSSIPVLCWEHESEAAHASACTPLQLLLKDRVTVWQLHRLSAEAVGKFFSDIPVAFWKKEVGGVSASHMMFESQDFLAEPTLLCLRNHLSEYVKSTSRKLSQARGAGNRYGTFGSGQVDGQKSSPVVQYLLRIGLSS